MSENHLEILGLHAGIVGGESILNGVDLTIPKGEIHALMGPNGSGKSTLAKVVAGDPSYEITQGDILVDGESKKNAERMSGRTRLNRAYFESTLPSNSLSSHFFGISSSN